MPRADTPDGLRPDSPASSHPDSGEEDPEILKRCDLKGALKGGKLDLSSLDIDFVPTLAVDPVRVEYIRVAWLQDNRIAKLPPTIGLWKKVSQLRLSNNRIEILPPQIGKLKFLGMLHLDNNRLKMLPKELAQCDNLNFIDFTRNKVQRIPVQLGLLKKLKDIEYADNADPRRSTFPHKKVLDKGKKAVIAYLKRFTEAKKTGALNLTGVGLNEIPAEIAYPGPNLTSLDVSDIQPADGIKIPFEFGVCTQLKECKFHKFLKIVSPPEGTVKQGISVIVAYLARFNQAKVEGILDLCSMGLDRFPQELKDSDHMEPEKVQRFLLRDNMIKTLDMELGRMENLEELDASQNKLVKLPDALQNLKRLTVLNLTENCLLEVPQVLGKMADQGCLQVFNASRNQISTVSEKLEKLKDLRVFDVSKNQIRQIPKTIGLWSDLREFLVSENQITDFPLELCNLPRLVVLNISHNKIRRLPRDVGKLITLESLIVSNTSIFELPEEIGKLSLLTLLDCLACERLTRVPYQIADISRWRCPLIFGEPYLQELRLDPSFVRSPPPETIEKGVEEMFGFLNLMRVSDMSNVFTYSSQGITAIPEGIYQFSALTELTLTNNNLAAISEDVSKLTTLKTLTLDFNQLVTLPTTVSGLGSLTLLSLKNNPLETLPVQLGMCARLRLLELGFPGPDMQIPPKEVSRKGGAAVLDYLRRMGVTLKTGRQEAQRLGLIKMPSEFQDMSHVMWRLSLAHNRIAELDDAMSLCHKLKVLRLHDNMLSDLPNSLSALTGLHDLDLEGNRFELCPYVLSSLTSLTLLRLSRNELIECPVHVCKLTLLEELSLDYNKLSVLPNRIGMCVKLKYLSVSHNELTRLPAGMKDLIVLSTLNVSNNKLTIIPPEVGLLPSLEHGDFDNNPIASPPLGVMAMGTMSVSHFLARIQEMKDSGKVDLDNSNLDSIPLDVLSYDAVHTIIMTHNLLTTIPEKVGGLRHLTCLDVSFNKLTLLPDSIGNCIALQELYLTKNELTDLPWTMEKLTNLRVLDCDLERITCPPMSVTKRGGTETQRFFHALVKGRDEHSCRIENFDLMEIPVEVLQMHNLLELSLLQNHLKTLPPSLVEFTRLEILNVDENPQMLTLPRILRNMTSILVFSMASNSLKTIPDEIFRLTNLTVLNVSRNNLEGIGNLLGNLSHLVQLDLSHNKLWNLPWPAMMKMIYLEKLELQDNPLTLLPASIADLTRIAVLDLADTELKMLPADMINMVNLEILNLENVDIEGPNTLTVAAGIENIMEFLKLMRECRVSSNLSLKSYQCEGGRKMGFQPYNLCTALTSLTLVESELEFVPSAVLDLSNLTFLDLSDNKLQHFPDSVGVNLEHLETLLIRNNTLKSLPSGIGGLTALETLVLSSNALETLPKSIGKCTNLAVLDLKDNHVNFLPKEILACKKITNLDMEFRYLTVLQSLNLPWSSWGDPASDVLIQGAKIVQRYYKELARAAGQGQDLAVMLGKSDFLDLHKYGLLALPQAVTKAQGPLSHLTSLNLSENHLQSISDDISNLVNLRKLDMKGCPLKRLPIALGALEEVVIAADLKDVRNIPDVFLAKEEDGVMDYLRKAYLEIEIGVLDLSHVGIMELPPDLTDLISISQLSLERNNITFLPFSIQIMTNLTNFALNDNRLCCLPRHLGELTNLTTLALQGNRIAMVPSDIGRLTNLSELIFDAETLLPVPSEVQYMGVNAIVKFLGKIETSRGFRRMVNPMPGLKAGESFDVNFDGQVYTVTVPKGQKGRNKFESYLPLVPREIRSNMVLAGYDFMKDARVGNTLDLSDCQLTKWRLIAVQGSILDDAQDDFYVRGTSISPPKDTFEFMSSTGDDRSVASDVSGLSSTGTASTFGSSVFGSVFGSKTKEKVKEHDSYQVNAEGILRNLTAEIAAEEAAAEQEGQSKTVAFLKSLAGLKKKEIDGPIRDLPILRYETLEPIATWMVDTTMNTSFPLPICCATNVTALNLDRNKITSIPSSIGTLSHLVTLSARYNKIESISWRLRYLVHLRAVYLRHNRLVHLPPKIGRCERLQVLDVSKNYLVQLPVSIGRLSLLKTLDVSDNPIQFLPHEIGGVDNAAFSDVVGLLSLERLLASKCSQLRYLPSKLYRLTALEQLELVGATSLVNPPWEVIDQGFDAVFAFLKRLYDCENSGSFDLSNVGLYWPPLCLAELEKRINEQQGEHLGMPELLHLDLSRNIIKELPPYMKVLTNLRSLQLDYNRLQVLPSFFSLLTRLGVLSMNHNKLKALCPEMGNLLSIRSIIANNNKIDHIFDGVLRLSTLLELSLNNNDIGLIPDCLLGLSELQYLRLGANRIRAIPKTMVSMKGLHQLVLYDNQLTAIPEEMGEMLELRDLDVAGNRIEMLPLGLGSLTNMTKLEVRRNGCIRPPKGSQDKGPEAVISYLRSILKCKKHHLFHAENFGLTAFPIDVLELHDVTELNLSHNSIATMPEEIHGLTRLACLRMANNGMTNVPVTICRIQTLHTLDLHGNVLGQVPPVFADMTRLTSLNLSSNKFEIFPEPVERMTQLQLLDFTGNGLTRLPYFIGRLVCATAILLGGNQLMVIPDSIGANDQIVLSTLNLSHNGLKKVPGALCNVLSLQTVCLSGNHLDELPSQMGRLANLQELWIDNNKLKLLPPTAGGWEKMQRLLMHNNQLRMIPKNLPDLTELQVLTLSGNQLSSLPWNLWKLTKLEELWLDCNKLQRLPEGIEKMPSLKSVSCRYNPYLRDEAERAENIMLMFPDTDGAMRLRELENESKRELERLELEEDDRIFVGFEEAEAENNANQRSALDDLNEEMELLHKDLDEALNNKDYEGADRLQTLIDELAAKIEGGGFGRVPSVEGDSTTFSVRVEVMRCSGLVSPSKKAPSLSPYVSSHQRSCAVYIVHPNNITSASSLADTRRLSWT